jgi:SAM-dependent methyltransferase
MAQHIIKSFPELNIIQGDILDMPFGNDFFDVILSYGVVEHFPKGLQDPLKSLYKVLKPGGIAIVTVPSLNKLSQINYYIGRFIEFINFKKMLPSERYFTRNLYLNAIQMNTRIWVSA